MATCGRYAAEAEHVRSAQALYRALMFMSVCVYVCVITQEKRLNFLLTELKGKRPLMPPGMDLPPEVAEVIATFRWVWVTHTHTHTHTLTAYTQRDCTHGLAVSS